jgi:hypothetical protein
MMASSDEETIAARCELVSSESGIRRFILSDVAA